MSTIDLRSDTVTQPTAEMKAAMVAAPLGDDVMGEDPTVNALEARVAAILGKEAAVFTCTATQANQIAVRLHTRPGDEILIHRTGHIGLYEAGAPAAISGVSMRQLDGDRGLLDVATLEALPWPDDPHFTRTRLLCLENTTNIAGGRVYPLERMQTLGQWAGQQGLRSHLDGARFFNATVAARYQPAQIAECVDTVTLCFSKGLGCPMGAILAGSAEAMHQARRVRKMLGGGMRQAGMMAAAARYALDHHIDALAHDHSHARQLANGLAQLSPVAIDTAAVETNLVFFDLDPDWGTPATLISQLAELGVKVGGIYQQRMRAATHRDVTTEQIEIAVEAFAKVLR